MTCQEEGARSRRVRLCALKLLSSQLRPAGPQKTLGSEGLPTTERLLLVALGCGRPRDSRGVPRQDAVGSVPRAWKMGLQLVPLEGFAEKGMPVAGLTELAPSTSAHFLSPRLMRGGAGHTPRRMGASLVALFRLTQAVSAPLRGWPRFGQFWTPAVGVQLLSVDTSLEPPRAIPPVSFPVQLSRAGGARVRSPLAVHVGCGGASQACRGPRLSRALAHGPHSKARCAALARAGPCVLTVPALSHASLTTTHVTDGERGHW